VSGQYRFEKVHYELEYNTHYQLRAADDLSTPTYQDLLDIATNPAPLTN
jgi:hypothetical protein